MTFARALAALPALLLTLASAALPAQPRPALSEAEQVISTQLKRLRKVPDDQRADATRQIALAIRALPPGSPNRLSLAAGVANLATEGDFGRATLREVANTLAGALREKAAAGAPAQELERPISTLAQLARYEEVPVKLDLPAYAAALQQLQQADRQRAAADFTLQDLSGKSWHLKELQGKVVLVNFWATWCPPCRKEMPDLEALYRKHQPQGLLVLALSDEDESKVRPFIQEKAYTFPVLLDPAAAAAKRFAVDGIPKSFLFNRKGKLVAQAIDMRTRGQFEKLLKKAGL